MKENLTTRVKRIISGGASAIVASIENAAPEVVMEEAIREIDGAIADVRAELGKAAAQRHNANQRLVSEGNRHETLREQAEVAVKEGRDDLASAAISRQMDIEVQLPVLESTIADSDEEIKRLESMISGLQGRRREMLEDLRRFRERAKAQASGNAVPDGSSRSDSAEQRAEGAAAAFDRIAEKALGVSSGSRATLDEEQKLAELEDLSRKRDIEARLARLKSEVR